MSINANTITALRQFVSSNPAYIIVCGDPNTDVNDIETVVKMSAVSFRRKGRNPILVGITNNVVSEVAACIAEEIKVPVMFGDVDTVVRDIDSRNLRKDHVQVSFMYTPEYAGSAEHLALLYGCRRFGGTLRSWSNFHHQWMNCKWSAHWVPGYNAQFLTTINAYSWSEQEKMDYFAHKIGYIRKYKTLYARKDKGGSNKVAQVPNPAAKAPVQMVIPAPMPVGARVF